MKKLHYLFLVLLFAACSTNKTDGVEIQGKLSNSKGEKIYLEELNINQINIKDSAIVDETGEFSLQTKIGEKSFYRLKTDQNNFIVLILDSLDEKINIEGDATNLANTYKIEGSEDSQLLWELNNVLKKNFQMRDSLQQVYQQNVDHPRLDSIGRVLEAHYNASTGNLRAYIKNFIDKHSESFASLAAIEQLNPDTDFDYFKKLSENLNKKYPNSSYVQAFLNKVNDLKKLVIGSPAPEITLSTPEGTPLSLSSLKGKIVLIDFWASWCKPCHMENPNVVKLYNKYKPKGFEIFGVSLDKEKEAWVNAIKQDNLTWLHVSDLAFWNSPVVKSYGITGIPFTVLVDKEGNILAKGLRGEELENKLEELLPHHR